MPALFSEVVLELATMIDLIGTQQLDTTTG